MTINYIHIRLFRSICFFMVIAHIGAVSSCQRQSVSDSVDSVIISGILEDGNTDSLFLVWDHPADRIKFPLGKDGSFHQEITFSYPRFVNLEINRFFTYPIYIEAGDSIFIRIKNGGMTDEPPVFEGDDEDRNDFILGIEYLTWTSQNHRGWGKEVAA